MATAMIAGGGDYDGDDDAANCDGNDDAHHHQHLCRP